MTEEKGHDFGRIVQDRSRGFLRPRDHNHRQPQISRGENFGEGRPTAAVLGHEHIDRFLAQELFLRFKREGAAPKDDAMAWQIWRKRERLNSANKIEMLRRRREGPDLQAADCQKNAPRFMPERGGGGHIGGIYPIVPRFWNPRWARQNDKRNIRPRGRDGRMARHLSGERMRGVYEHIDALGFEIGFKSVHAAKTAGPTGNFWRARCSCSTGKRQQGRNAALPRKEVRELARLKSPAKDENPHRSFPELLLSPP